jgi:hypothetical protein
VPVTVTASLNFTATCRTCPEAYVPGRVDRLTAVGRFVSGRTPTEPGGWLGAECSVAGRTSSGGPVKCSLSPGVPLSSVRRSRISSRSRERRVLERRLTRRLAERDGGRQTRNRDAQKGNGHWGDGIGNPVGSRRGPRIRQSTPI